IVFDTTAPFDSQERQGGKFTTGAWITARQTVGIEATYFFLGAVNPHYSTHSQGTPILTRPFLNPPGTPHFITVAAPGLAPGTAELSANSRIDGAEANFRFEWMRRPWFHLDWLLGVRYFHLDENLSVTTRSTDLETGDVTVLFDGVGTDNRFLGGQLGMEVELHHGCFFIDLWGKFAVGSNHERVDISGGTSVNGTTTPVGLLAQPSNIGLYRHDKFTVLPETGTNLGLQLGDHCRVTFGYSILYLLHAARPGEQLDPNVDPTQATPNPTFRFHESGFWAQGVNAGVEF